MAHNIRKTVIKNVRVFDGSRITEAQTIVIDGDVIGDSPEGAADVIDGEGGVLLPGLIDAHVHVEHQGDLRALAKYGVTTALDMACWPAEKMNALRGQVGLTDIRSAGLPATASGTLHSHILPLPEEALLSGPEVAHDFVHKRIAEGSDYIKIIADVPGPKQETLTAIVKEAHKNDMKVVAHAATYTPFHMALEAGADVITHSPLDKPVDSAIVERMKASKVVSVPTLIMMQGVSKTPPLSAIFGMLFKPFVLVSIIKTKRAGLGAQDYANARASVAQMYRDGVPILAGTDCHGESELGSFASVEHGVSLHQELELLVQAGLSTVDTLRAATILPAQHFGLADRGAIEPGKRADLVLLRKDPVEDIRNSRSIARVWCNGVEFTDSS